MSHDYHADEPLDVDRSDMEAAIHVDNNPSILILSSAFDVLDVTFACQALNHHMKFYELMQSTHIGRASKSWWST